MNNDARREIKKEHAHTGKAGIAAQKEAGAEGTTRKDRSSAPRALKGDGRSLPQESARSRLHSQHLKDHREAAPGGRMPAGQPSFFRFSL